MVVAAAGMAWVEGAVAVAGKTVAPLVVVVAVAVAGEGRTGVGAREARRAAAVAAAERVACRKSRT